MAEFPTARLARALLQAGAAVAPQRAFELARYGEAALRFAQGKGWGGTTTDVEAKAISRFLPPSGSVVFDVGAAKGLWSTALLRHADQRIERIFAFEPSSENILELQRLASPKVEIVQAAVSSHAGPVTLFADFAGSGLASLQQRRLDHFGLAHIAQEVVQAVTLDEFVSSMTIDVVHFLKLDIEGHELKALEGAGHLLAERRIRALSFEFGAADIDTRTFFQDFWYLLTGFGFQLFRIVPGSRLLPIKRYTEDLETFKVTNYVAALPPSK